MIIEHDMMESDSVFRCKVLSVLSSAESRSMTRYKWFQWHAKHTHIHTRTFKMPFVCLIVYAFIWQISLNVCFTLALTQSHVIRLNHSVRMMKEN